jgi:hypothetical protein
MRFCPNSNDRQISGSRFKPSIELVQVVKKLLHASRGVDDKLHEGANRRESDALLQEACCAASLPGARPIPQPGWLFKSRRIGQ